MCGICGHRSFPGTARVASRTVMRMVTALAHRGPDAQAISRHGRLTLGHARLSIIDLAGGDQPLFSENRQVVVVCNGEIYNYHELREELRLQGHSFETDSDSEVLVHLWEQHGPALLPKLRGMFALAVYDNRDGTLFLARDAHGQKPLYYHHGPGGFAFASEIGALLEVPGLSREIDVTALDQFLFYQYVPQPRTMFQAIRQLPAGHSLLQRGEEFTIEPWFRPVLEADTDRDDAEHIEELEEALEDAVCSHMVSDVPVGVFLSGGIDSSLVLAAASRHSDTPLQTFSIAFRGTADDESPYARLAARTFGSVHEEIVFEPENVIALLEAVGRLYGQPLADSAAMPVLSLSEHASRHLKVVLTGDGGDELFGGYRKYRRAATAIGQNRLLTAAGHRLFSTGRLARCQADRLKLRRLQSRIGMLLAPAQRSSYHRRFWEGWDRHGLYQNELAEAVAGSFELPDAEVSGTLDGLPSVNRMLRLDQAHYLPDDLLLKTDHATMAHGLEARAPLLDPRLSECAARLPVHLKVTPQETKVALRKIAQRWLPAELANRRKKGFSFPLRDWFGGPLADWTRDLLLENSTAVPRFFRKSHVERVLGEHLSGRRDHAGRIYTLLTFELWHRNFAA